MTIDRFDGCWAYLSNFYPSLLTWEGIDYPSGEHAFAAAKTLNRTFRQVIANAPTPLAAKRLGRDLRLRPDWEDKVRYRVMAQILRAKFTRHEGRRRALLATGDDFLIEGNTWHDNHWGDCRCGRPACQPIGGNHLGFALMALRELLHEEAAR